MFRIIASILIVFAISFTAFYGKNKINLNSTYNQNKEYKGIITLWQIDSFEGGCGSRKQFLLDVARNFEKENSGVLVMVCSFTSDEANEKLKSGVEPDLISFGSGVTVNPKCSINQNGDAGGKLKDKSYAISWCRGGYYLITDGVSDICEKYNNGEKILLDNLLLAKQKYLLPQLAAQMANIKAMNITETASDRAYYAFINKKTQAFIGTQRDIVRLSNANVDYKAVYLKEFCDINQYIAITTSDKIKSIYCERFINFLLSEKQQQKLSKIAMASYITDVKFENENLNQMQNMAAKNTISAFTMPEEIIKTQYLALQAVSDKSDKEYNFKNIIINS